MTTFQMKTRQMNRRASQQRPAPGGTRRRLPLLIGTGALILSLGLAGCSAAGSTSDGTPTAPSKGTGSTGAQANAADQMFVTMMIPHHQQALEMSDIVLAKPGLDPRVAELAEKIKAAQQPEIDRMQGWLTDWGVDDSAGSGMDHEGMGHGAMSGMLSADELDALRAADATEAGRLFLSGMIAHHEGAVEMARSAVNGGRNPEVVALAEQVIADQTAEIGTMRQLLGEG